MEYMALPSVGPFASLMGKEFLEICGWLKFSSVPGWNGKLFTVVIAVQFCESCLGQEQMFSPIGFQDGLATVFFFIGVVSCQLFICRGTALLEVLRHRLLLVNSPASVYVCLLLQ